MSLVELCAARAAAGCDVEDIAAFATCLPVEAMAHVWRHMLPAKLRALELFLSSNDPLLDAMQLAWRDRIVLDGASLSHRLDAAEAFANASETTTFISTTTITSSYREAYWEHQFRQRLADHDVHQTNASNQEDHMIPLALFQGVVRQVKVRGSEMTQANVDRMLALRSIERIELHHIQLNDATSDLLSLLVTGLPALREVCILHSKLPSIAPLLRALSRPLGVLGFASVKLSAMALRDLVQAIDTKALQVRRLRLNNSVADLDGVSGLVRVGSCGPDSLVLQFNELEDDALQELHAPATLHRLSLSHNCLTDVAPLARCSQLRALDLSGNELGDAGAATLATAVLPQLFHLQELYVVACAFTDVGGGALLAALATTNPALHTLNLSRNYGGPAFSVSLAAFVAAMGSLRRLHANSIGLGETPHAALLNALSDNASLQEVSFGENRLRSRGAAALFAALWTRAASAPFAAIDLRGNLITDDGLIAMAATTTGRKRKAVALLTEGVSSRIEALNLQDNPFSTAVHATALPQLRAQVGRVLWSGHRPAASVAYDDEA
ncbi:hypothetical protein ACHHYP_12659 [Achlya hypogyna]|uniref:Uncharacterized protein n=1 Tax=Achlya hypogyna TaxID=1202772 RepID=A0A1V9ZGP1_ACHHY|nr:hypothetical protein ACHHYP_12659 [Achlya hypogyna]